MNFDKQKYYDQDYQVIMNNGLIGMVSRFIHKHIDWAWRNREIGSVLEVGAGNGQHFNLGELNCQEYLEVDIRKLNRITTNKSEIVPKRLVCDATHLKVLPDSSYDLVIATCLIAHLDFPEVALRNWRRVLKKPGGELCIYVPCDPGLVLRFLRFFTTKRKFVKMGYNHAYQHWTEHRNHFPMLDTLIKEVFAQDRVSRSFIPFYLKSWNLNIYCLYRIRVF